MPRPVQRCLPREDRPVGSADGSDGRRAYDAAGVWRGVGRAFPLRCRSSRALGGEGPPGSSVGRPRYDRSITVNDTLLTMGQMPGPIIQPYNQPKSDLSECWSSLESFYGESETRLDFLASTHEPLRTARGAPPPPTLGAGAPPGAVTRMRHNNHPYRPTAKRLTD